MVQRKLLPFILHRLRQFPAVALIGPRQCGKTTLAKSLSSWYFDLETAADQTRLDVLWLEVIAQESTIILDEAQAWPEVFPRLRAAIDHDRKRKGRFLLLGSVSPALMKEVSESLAGRLSILELSPFSFDEIPGQSDPRRLSDHWLYGGYPDGGILDQSNYPQWQQDYLTLMIQRDLPNWGLPAKPQTTERLARMLAAVSTQAWNASRLGASLGLNHNTINDYCEFLTGGFLLRFLKPYHVNLKKRLIKSPKVYWRDSGLLHSLLGIRNLDELLSHPSAGASWEGYVIEQIINQARLLPMPPTPYFLRTSDQKEIDLILDFGASKWGIEIKMTTDPSPGDLRLLNQIASLAGIDERFFLCLINETWQQGPLTVGPLSSLIHKLKSLHPIPHQPGQA